MYEIQKKISLGDWHTIAYSASERWAEDIRDSLMDILDEQFRVVKSDMRIVKSSRIDWTNSRIERISNATH